jgi:signal transduction histidine kinase
MFKVKNLRNTSKTKNRGFFWEARTRILLWYTLMMTGMTGLSLPIFSHLVFTEVNARVRGDLQEEIETFDAFVTQQNPRQKLMTKRELEYLFQEFLYRRIPEDDTFLITIVQGRFYRSSPRALPALMQENSDLMKYWREIKQQEEREKPTKNPEIGSIIYSAKPITFQGKIIGTFVVAHTSSGELREAKDIIIIVFQVLAVFFIAALLFAWIASGKVLSALRSFDNTAKLIGEKDLNQRLPIQGTGELADLSLTFNEMMDRLQATFVSQRAFINDAGHELRTPITIIRGHLELMGDDPEEQKETLALVIDELDRMSRIVDDLLLLAKSERPDFVQLEMVNIAELTREIYTKITALGDRNWLLDSSGEGWLYCDRQRITQAILNLAVNASQHTTATDTITIGCQKNRTSVRIWVRDTGTGIAKADQERIFERFARVGNRHHASGAGLGLAIVKAIAQAHGGKIEVESELGVGSTFTLVLPLSAKF